MRTQLTLGTPSASKVKSMSSKKKGTAERDESEGRSKRGGVDPRAQKLNCLRRRRVVMCRRKGDKEGVSEPPDHCRAQEQRVV